MTACTGVRTQLNKEPPHPTPGEPQGLHKEMLTNNLTWRNRKKNTNNKQQQVHITHLDHRVWQCQWVQWGQGPWSHRTQRWTSRWTFHWTAQGDWGPQQRQHSARPCCTQEWARSSWKQGSPASCNMGRWGQAEWHSQQERCCTWGIWQTQGITVCVLLLFFCFYSCWFNQDMLNPKTVWVKNTHIESKKVHKHATAWTQVNLKVLALRILRVCVCVCSALWATHYAL